MRKKIFSVSLAILFVFALGSMFPVMPSAASPTSVTNPGLWSRSWNLFKGFFKFTAVHGDDVARLARNSDKLDDLVKITASLPKGEAFRKIVEFLVKVGLLTPTDSLLLARTPGLDELLIQTIRKSHDLQKVLPNIVRASRIFSVTQIDELAKLPVGKTTQILNSMDLSQGVQECVYLRILLAQKKISDEFAGALYSNLKGTSGFLSTMKKVSSSNMSQQAGHLFELQLANASKNRGVNVLGIGEKFKDFAKKGMTDVDLRLEHKGRRIFIEAKNYSDVDWPSLATFRGDMDSLGQAQEVWGKAELYFVISNTPSNPKIIEALRYSAQQKGIKLLFGSAEEVLVQIL